MNLSGQLLALAQRIESAGEQASRCGSNAVAVNATEMIVALRRIANVVAELELQTDRRTTNLSHEYVSDITTRARWALSNAGASELVRELATAVLNLAQPAHY